MAGSGAYGVVSLFTDGSNGGQRRVRSECEEEVKVWAWGFARVCAALRAGTRESVISDRASGMRWEVFFPLACIPASNDGWL